MRCETNARVQKIAVNEHGFDITIRITHGLLAPQELSELSKATKTKEDFGLIFESRQQELPFQADDILLCNVEIPNAENEMVQLSDITCDALGEQDIVTLGQLAGTDMGVVVGMMEAAFPDDPANLEKCLHEIGAVISQRNATPEGDLPFSESAPGDAMDPEDAPTAEPEADPAEQTEEAPAAT